MNQIYRHEFAAMGTDCSIVISAQPWHEDSVRRAIDAAVDEVEAAERDLSRFDPRSELTQLNVNAGEWMVVGDRLYAAVAAAKAGRRATGGRFDPTVLPALIAAGYDRTYTELEPHDAPELGTWRAGAAIDLDPARRSVRLAPGSAIDLGGVGKGFAANAALEAMWRCAPTQLGGALVDLGGDIASRGRAPDGGAWRIAVADPRTSGGRLAVLGLAGDGIATSGRDRRRLGHGGTGHHLIDPATGRPALPGPLAVTVAAPTTILAEINATALAITPLDECERYVQSRPELAALVVPSAGPPRVYGRLPLLVTVPELAGAA